MIAPDELDEKLAELRGLRDRKSELQNQIKGVQEKLDEVNFELVEYFEATDTKQIRKENLGLFYISRTSYPKIDNMDAVQNWLKERGELEDMMSFNSNKFRSYFNELMEDNRELPPNVDQFIKTEIRMRRS